MPRRLTPVEAAEKRRRERYAPLLAQIRAIRGEGGAFRAELGRRTKDGGRKLGGAWRVLDLALARRAAGLPAPEPLSAPFEFFAAVTAANDATRADGLEPPIEFLEPPLSDVGAPLPRRGRPPGRPPTWASEMIDILTTMWKEERVVFFEGGIPKSRLFTPTQAANRVWSGIRGRRPSRRDIERAVGAIYRLRDEMEEEVREVGLANNDHGQDAWAAAYLRHRAMATSGAPIHVREAAARKAMIDLGIDP